MGGVGALKKSLRSRVSHVCWTLDMATRFRVALCQLLVGADKAVNLAAARASIDAAAVGGAQVVTLPECFIRYLSGRFGTQQLQLLS